MTTSQSIHRALISVSDKAGVVDFARTLHDNGAELISTGGTAKVLLEAGLPVTPVDAVTGFPEMLDGRVKTLHPLIHGGLLGRRDNPQHVQAMSSYNIEPIDLVCIDLYPFEQTITDTTVTELEAIEQIDIGGPAMIRSAAKNFEFVTVVTNPSQYALLYADFAMTGGKITAELRRDLATAAFSRTAEYDTIISSWMQGEEPDAPTHMQINGQLEQTLRYGENPDQTASLYRDTCVQGPNVVTASVVAGKPLSYNNLFDAAAALEVVLDLHAYANKPAAAIIKHTNPCGAAFGSDLTDAFTRAWRGDPLAAFGGIVALSGPATEDVAHQIVHGDKFLEVIVAPTFTEGAKRILSDRWKNVRLLEVGDDPRPTHLQQVRSVAGGFLLQSTTPTTAKTDQWEVVTGPAPSTQMLDDAAIAWITCSHLKSNAISIVADGSLIGGGMGQVDRVSAAKLAIERAGAALTDAKTPVAGSDAFFPFPDGPQLLIDAGIKCIVQPGGSVRDQETIDVCEQAQVTLLHTGMRCFRH
ncbi:MAG: bifunctional phosphoribosylaminoimidazolecarboxamide formyltransferase/IMP cyclohydrolase [Phycisphaerales bacterium]|jgi:phosphoribosylaminoimidazolecarboxamide formyltransferase/IMP cyclohydrolase|nr:bifunctional phosphoribosylaminoimidazolecarboxamide formyltransferase/IMP cyclohydrolase [Phycisphaerales bacterium]